MFRFLIVEDDLSTVTSLTQLIEMEFTPPGPAGNEPQIDHAHTVDDAMRLIQTARKPYHAVILDFKLPQHRLGENTQVNETLCVEVRRKMPRALVAHITSHPEDGLVKEHLKIFHTERVNPHAFALSKLDVGYAEKLLKNLKAFLYGKPIEEGLDELFGEGDVDLFPAEKLRSARERGRTSLTHDLANLCCDIVTHWDDLDANLQERIARTLNVDVCSRPVKIKLF
jgi:CheY-like chemotaxis protein